MTLFLIAGAVFLLASGAAHAQQREPATPATRELPAPPKVKSKRTAQAPAPARAVQRDSTARPAVPKKSKSSPAAQPRQEKKLPRVDKPAKPSA